MILTTFVIVHTKEKYFNKALKNLGKTSTGDKVTSNKLAMPKK